MRRLGLNFASVIGTKTLPNEPVPPVTKIDLFVNNFTTQYCVASHFNILCKSQIEINSFFQSDGWLMPHQACVCNNLYFFKINFSYQKQDYRPSLKDTLKSGYSAIHFFSNWACLI